MDGLDEYSAFEIDGATALRFHLEERDADMDLLENVNSHIRGVIQSLQPKKLPKPKKRRRLTIEPGDKLDEIPSVDMVIAGLTGTTGKVVVEAH